MGGKPSLRSVVLVAAAVAAGSLVIALAIGAALRWDFPGFARDGFRGDGTGIAVDEQRSVPAQGIERIAVTAVN